MRGLGDISASNPASSLPSPTFPAPRLGHLDSALSLTHVFFPDFSDFKHLYTKALALNSARDPGVRLGAPVLVLEHPCWSLSKGLVAAISCYCSLILLLWKMPDFFHLQDSWNVLLV